MISRDEKKKNMEKSFHRSNLMTHFYSAWLN